jgi:hypothetical protein
LDNELQEILTGVDDILEKTYRDCTPPEIAGMVYRFLANYTGVKDPYAKIKAQSNKQMLEQYTFFNNRVSQSDDPIKQAILYAGMGNAIDFGADPDFKLDNELGIEINIRPNIFDYSEFRIQLQNANKILYLADNAGETILDRILIERLEKPVVYSVKSIPIINDALYEDALIAGIDHVAEIVESGTFCPGTVLKTCDHSFQILFQQTDLIIAKGQGNYEALCGENAPIFFLLKVKCDLISRHLQSPIGSLVLKCNR